MAKRGVSGNSMEESRQFGEILIRQAQVLHQVTATFERWDTDNRFVQSVTFRAPTMTRDSWLGVIKATSEAGAFVAFHDAPTFAEAVYGMCERIRNGTLQWKDDQYASGR